jgi:acetyl-CoA C-acetyltransferase
MIDAFIYDGIRTPFGRHAGNLASVRPDDLLATSIRALMARSPFAPDGIEDVIAGCTNQAGEDSRNVARRAALLAGLPVEVAGITVNRLCASGLAAVVDAARAVAVGQGDVFIAGGVESMSRAPFVMAKSERAYGRELQVFDTTLGSRFPNPRQRALFGDHAMPETAEEVGKDLGIGRDESDRFAPQMAEKGRVRTGADADLTLFDPDRIINRATYDAPDQYSDGIVHVLVGGTFVVRDGELVDGVAPGKPIRGRFAGGA